MLGHPDRLWGRESRHDGIAANGAKFWVRVVHALGLWGGTGVVPENCRA